MKKALTILATAAMATTVAMADVASDNVVNWTATLIYDPDGNATIWCTNKAVFRG